MENTQTPNDQTPPNSRAAEVPNGQPGDNEEHVSLAQFKQVKDDMHRYKDDLRKKDSELQAVREKEMREKEQWKELAQLKEKEANEYKLKLDTRDKATMERAKISSVREAAIKLGLVETAFDDLEYQEFKGVIVETTSTGRVNVIGAKAAAEQLKASKPHWFSENRVPNVNSNAPGVKPTNPGRISYEEISKLEEQAKKTGDQTEYLKAVKAYKTQR